INEKVRFVVVTYLFLLNFFFFFSSRRRHTRLQGDWSSDVCSSDLCVFLVQDRDRTGGQQEADDAVIVRAGNEACVVMQHGGNDAGGAIGWGRHHAPARGVFLVDGEIGRASCRERV